MEKNHGACLLSILLTVPIHHLEQVGIRDMTFCCQCAPKYICCRLIEAPRAHFISEIKPPACKLSHACTRLYKLHSTSVSVIVFLSSETLPGQESLDWRGVFPLQEMGVAVSGHVNKRVRRA